MNENLIDRLKNLGLDERFLFKKEDFENWNSQLSYPELVVLEGNGRFSGYFYNAEYPVEVVDHQKNVEFCGYKDSYIQWGVDLVAMVLTQTDVLEIELSHSKSGIKKLYVYRDQRKPIDYFGLKYSHILTMKSFNYYSRNVVRYPFNEVEELYIPSFKYAWQNDQERYKQNTLPDYVVITASTEGLLYLAEVFLNFGRVQEQNNEINFERVSSGFLLNSLEARFWLPGSLFFYNDDLESLNP